MYRVTVDGIERECALAENTALEQATETGQQFFRKKISGTLTFRGSFAAQIIAAAYGTTWQVEIHKKTAGSWVLECSGYFTHTDCEIDYDDNTVKAKIQPDDEYTTIEKKKSVEYAILEEDVPKSDKAITVQSWIKVIRRRIYDPYNEPAPDPDWQFEAFAHVVTEIDQELGIYKEWTYYAREESYAIPDPNDLTWWFMHGDGDDHEEHTGLWVRTYEHCKPGLQAYPNFFLQTDPPCAGETPHPCGDFGQNNDPIHCPEYGPVGWYIYPPTNECIWELLDSQLHTLEPQVCETYFLKSEDLTGCQYEIPIRNAMKLSDVIRLLVQKADPALTFEEDSDHSRFLFDTPNNPLLETQGYPTDKTQRLNSLFLIHMKDCSQMMESQDAYDSKLSLDKVLKWLAVLVNGFYHIEGEKFRIEHLSWYENGKSYGGLRSITKDLVNTIEPRTQLPLGYHQNKIKYEKQDMPWREVWKYAHETRSPRIFDELSLTYPGNAVDQNKEENHEATNLDANLIGVFRFGREFGPEGWMLVCCDENGMVLNETSLDDGTTQIMNGHLCWWHLLLRYNLHGRVQRTASCLNRTITTRSQNKIKSQEVEYVDEQTPDPYGQVRTDVGDGDIETVKTDLQTRKHRITINHSHE